MSYEAATSDWREDTYWFTSGNCKANVNIFSNSDNTTISIVEGSFCSLFDKLTSVSDLSLSSTSATAWAEELRFFNIAAVKPAAQTYNVNI